MAKITLSSIMGLQSITMACMVPSCVFFESNTRIVRLVMQPSTFQYSTFPRMLVWWSVPFLSGSSGSDMSSICVILTALKHFILMALTTAWVLLLVSLFFIWVTFRPTPLGVMALMYSTCRFRRQLQVGEASEACHERPVL